MSKPGSRTGFAVIALVGCGWMLFTSPSSATLDMQKQAKAAGVDAKNCQTCHVASLPKKDSHELNDAGKWLVAEKDKRGAKTADGAWLKDYPGKK
jgi:alkyl sulfatase BDS1-like metallo-beta-lactamase superfamily hydrolase